MSNRAELKDAVSLFIADSPPLNITAEHIRNLNADSINSFASLLDENIWQTPNEYYSQAFDKIKFANRIDVRYIPLSIQSTIPFGDYIANVFTLAGGYDTIGSFDFFANNIIHVYISDPCILAASIGQIPTNSFIYAKGGDSFTAAIFITNDGLKWVITNYQQGNGRKLPTLSDKIFSINDFAPTLSESELFQYYRGFRWISVENDGRAREWISQQQTDPAIWNPASGSCGLPGSGSDFEISIVPIMLMVDPITLTAKMRYINHGTHIELMGYVETCCIPTPTYTIGFQFYLGDNMFGLQNLRFKEGGFFGKVYDVNGPLDDSDTVFSNNNENLVVNISPYIIGSVRLEFITTLLYD